MSTSCGSNLAASLQQASLTRSISADDTPATKLGSLQVASSPFCMSRRCVEHMVFLYSQDADASMHHVGCPDNSTCAFVAHSPPLLGVSCHGILQASEQLALAKSRGVAMHTHVWCVRQAGPVSGSEESLARRRSTCTTTATPARWGRPASGRAMCTASASWTSASGTPTATPATSWCAASARAAPASAACRCWTPASWSSCPSTTASACRSPWSRPTSSGCIGHRCASKPLILICSGWGFTGLASKDFRG